MRAESKPLPRAITDARDKISVPAEAPRKAVEASATPSTSPHRARFVKLYCEQTGLRPEHFVAEIYQQTLYFHARWLRFIPAPLRTNGYTADYDFITEVGEIQSYRDYELAVEGFRFHPLNAGWLRRYGRFRISVGRMSRLVHAVLRSEHHHAHSAT